MHMCVLSRLVVSDSCDPPDCSPPDSSVHGTLQARILGWVAISSSRGSSPSTDQTCISVSPALADRFFSATWEAHIITYIGVCVQSHFDVQKLTQHFILNILQ